MPRRLFTLAALCLSLLVWGATPGGSLLAAAPNVILIVADDLGYGDLSCYGQRRFTTPNLDRLADEGLRFTQFYAGNTVCSPSRACLMTGQHPGSCRVRGNGNEPQLALDPAMVVLPELFHEAGYRTGAFGKWGLGITNAGGAQDPRAHGFDRFVGWKSQVIAHTYYPTSIVVDGEEQPLPEGTYIHDRIMGEAMAFVEENARATQPFFCYLPTAIPHAAMHAPPVLHAEWRERLPEFDAVIGEYGAGPNEPCPPVVNPVAGFAAMIEHLDHQIGELLAVLKQTGADHDTLIVFTSDNGPHREGGHRPAFWDSNGPLRGLKRDLYEGGIRAPTLARWPAAIAAGSASDHIGASWDLMATFAELLGVPAPEQSDGVSVLPTLVGQPDRQTAHEFLFWQFDKRQRPFSQAVRSGPWKAFRRIGQPFELYNLNDDLGETHDLAAEYPEVVARLAGYAEKAQPPRLATQGKPAQSKP